MSTFSKPITKATHPTHHTHPAHPDHPEKKSGKEGSAKIQIPEKLPETPVVSGEITEAVTRAEMAE